jgi:sulfite reductase alpha subunit-like flavoprotein
MNEVPEHAEERAILILYATETGNSLDAAERIAREARRWHFHTRLASTDTYPLVSWLSRIERTLFFLPLSCPRTIWSTSLASSSSSRRRARALSRGR